MTTFDRTLARLLVLGCVSALGLGLAGPAQAAPAPAAATVAAAAPMAAAAAAGSAGSYAALAPARILDTRYGPGPVGAVSAGQSISVPVLGAGGIPASGVSAVQLNITVADPTSAGYLTVYADGAPMPAISNINFYAGQTIANVVIVPVLASGRIRLYYGGGFGSVQIIADSAGSYAAGTPTAAGTFQSVTPQRILDTRYGVGGARASLQPFTARPLTVVGAGGVPASGVRAVVLNAAVSGPTASGSLTVYPYSQPLAGVTSVSFAPGQTVADLVIVPVSSSGQVLFYNGSAKAINAIADVVGYYLGGNPGVAGSLLALPQVRLLDTRVSNPSGPIAPGGTRSLQVAGVGTIPPAGMTAVAVQITAVLPGSPGFLTVYPSGTPRPAGVSNVNFAAKETVTNLVIVPIGADGRILLYNSGVAGTYVIVDLVGVFLDGTGAARCNSAGVANTSDPVVRWNPLVSCILSALGQAQSASNISDVDTMILYESSGDPNAINNYDSNAQAGHPSEGLIQVIRPTFDQWRSPLLSNDLYNPAANLYAGLNYAINTYGSIHNVPGLVSLRGGGGYVGYIASK